MATFTKTIVKTYFKCDWLHCSKTVESDDGGDMLPKESGWYSRWVDWYDGDTHAIVDDECLHGCSEGHLDRAEILWRMKHDDWILGA